MAALKGGFGCWEGAGAAGFGSNTHGSRESFSPWIQDIGQLWNFPRNSWLLLGTMEPAGERTQTCSLRANIWTFLRFPASWRPSRASSPSFGEGFGSCSVFTSPLLSAGIPPLIFSMPIFHCKHQHLLSRRNPLFIPSALLAFLSVLSRLIWSHSEGTEVMLCWWKGPRFPTWIQVHPSRKLDLSRKGIHRADWDWSQSCWQKEFQIWDSSVGI